MSLLVHFIHANIPDTLLSLWYLINKKVYFSDSPSVHVRRDVSRWIEWRRISQVHLTFRQRRWVVRISHKQIVDPQYYNKGCVIFGRPYNFSDTWNSSETLVRKNRNPQNPKLCHTESMECTDENMHGLLILMTWVIINSTRGRVKVDSVLLYR